MEQVKRRILITGANGFIGAEYVAKSAADWAQRNQQRVFVTLAEKGMLCASADGSAEHVPAFPLRGEIDGSILFISHNLGAIAEICDRIAVFYAGEIVEQGPIGRIFDQPQHPYTRALIACDPARIAVATRQLPVIPGDVPNLRTPPKGCIFAARCPQVMDRCRSEKPGDRVVAEGHTARCHLLSTEAPS